MAEAARQERARKDQQRKTKHVYTDEDLRRAKILTPDDEARVEARRQTQPAPAEEQAQGPASGDEIAQLPLGDIARRYRNAKLAAQMPDAFHLPFDEPVFADPVISVPSLTAPRPSFSPTRPKLASERPNAVAPPAISSPAPVQAVGPDIASSKPARPVTSFSPAHPNLMAAHPDAAAAPVLAGKAPSASLDLSISAAKPARPATSLLPTHPNLAPTQPGGVIAPAMSNPAPLRRVDPFVRRFAPPAPPSAPTVREPKVGLAIAPSVGESNFSRSMAPAAMGNAAPVIAPPASLVKPSSSEHIVTVQAGDSLWKLAQRNLGRGSRWQELLAANPSIVDPTRLPAGTRIVVPGETSTLKHVEANAKIAVKAGDTLTKIAQSQYGNAAAWSCIAEANPEIVDSNRIYEGQQLLLPFNCKR